MKKILKFSSWLAIIAGVVMVVAGAWGIIFTYKNVSREKIVTPADAAIPNTPVRGPLTLKSQADIIRHHALKITGDKTYSQMPQKVQKVEPNGSLAVDDQGQPIMVSNDARTIWVTATTLTTALNLGIITYVFSGLIILLGLISIWTGVIFSIIKRNIN